MYYCLTCGKSLSRMETDGIRQPMSDIECFGIESASSTEADL